MKGNGAGDSIYLHLPNFPKVISLRLGGYNLDNIITHHIVR